MFYSMTYRTKLCGTIANLSKVLAIQIVYFHIHVTLLLKGGLYDLSFITDNYF